MFSEKPDKTRSEGGVCIFGCEGLLGTELLNLFSSFSRTDLDGLVSFFEKPSWQRVIEKQERSILSARLEAFINENRVLDKNGFAGGVTKTPASLRAFSRVRGFARKNCDITDTRRVSEILRKFKPEIILNAAAYTNVDGAESEFDTALNTNTRAVGLLALEAAKIGALLVHFSTDFVYERARKPTRLKNIWSGTGGEKVDDVRNKGVGKRCSPLLEDNIVGEIEGFREEDPPIPIPKGKYALSKLEGEKEVLKNNPEKTLVMRVGNLYGGFGKNFPSLLAGRLQILEAHHRLMLDSSRVMSPTWARCVALQVLCLVLDDCPAGLYHATCKGSTTWAGFAEEICRLLKIPPAFKKVSSKDLDLPAPRPEFHVLENAELAGLGLEIMPHWRFALAGYLADCGFLADGSV